MSCQKCPIRNDSPCCEVSCCPSPCAILPCCPSPCGPIPCLPQSCCPSPCGPQPACCLMPDCCPKVCWYDTPIVLNQGCCKFYTLLNQWTNLMKLSLFAQQILKNLSYTRTKLKSCQLKWFYHLEAPEESKTNLKKHNQWMPFLCICESIRLL